MNQTHANVVLTPSLSRKNSKYRGKIATTLEDKVVQVQSPKLAEISARLIHAENLCRRLLHFLVLQGSVAASPY